MLPTCPLPPGRTIRRWALMPADSTGLNSAASSIGSLRTNPSSHTDSRQCCILPCLSMRISKPRTRAPCVDLLWIYLYRTVDNIIGSLIDEAAKHDKGLCNVLVWRIATPLTLLPCQIGRAS